MPEYHTELVCWKVKPRQMSCLLSGADMVAISKISSMLSVAVQNWLVNIHQHYLSSSSPIWFSQNVGHAAPDEARLGPLLAMVHCYTKMELFVPAFSTLGIYRAAAADVLIKKAQTLMSNGLHTTLHLTHACSLTESQGTFSGPVRNSRLRQIELR